MFTRSLAETEQLMPGKLLLLLNRYAGNSVQLPPHEGVDDTVYGSLAIYRQEVIEELSQWAANHSFEELDAAVREGFSRFTIKPPPTLTIHVHYTKVSLKRKALILWRK